MWVKYQGEFKNDAKDGIGTLYLVNNDKFCGYFSEDQVHGKGKYTINNDDNTLRAQQAYLTTSRNPMAKKYFGETILG